MRFVGISDLLINITQLIIVALQSHVDQTNGFAGAVILHVIVPYTGEFKVIFLPFDYQKM